LIVDVPHPQGQGILNVQPPPMDQPRPNRVQEIASQCGWDHVTTERLSPGRSGMMLRKRVLTDSELVPVVTDLIANLQRVHAIDQRLASVESLLTGKGLSNLRTAPPSLDQASLAAETKRADDAEHALTRLRSRRSVKVALGLARPTRGLFRTIRSWKKRR
jgi:hypothetical protein